MLNCVPCNQLLPDSSEKGPLSNVIRVLLEAEVSFAVDSPSRTGEGGNRRGDFPAEEFQALLG